MPFEEDVEVASRAERDGELTQLRLEPPCFGIGPADLAREGEQRPQPPIANPELV